MPCRVFNSIPGLWPLKARSILSPKCGSQPCPQTLLSVPWGAKSPWIRATGVGAHTIEHLLCTRRALCTRYLLPSYSVGGGSYGGSACLLWDLLVCGGEGRFLPFFQPGRLEVGRLGFRGIKERNGSNAHSSQAASGPGSPPRFSRCCTASSWEGEARRPPAALPRPPFLPLSFFSLSAHRT